jgi:hypothetical protein
MFFNTKTVFKAYATEKAAIAYFNKNFASRNDVTVEQVGNLWMVVGA